MLLLKEALGATTTTDYFHVNANGKFWIDLSGTWGGGTITIKRALTQTLAEAGTFADFYPDGTLATFTANGVHEYEVPIGTCYRFASDGSISDVDIYVGGHAVKPGGQ